MFKRDLNDDSDGAHLKSFGIEFQTEEEAKENERSPSVALLCAGPLRRGMVYELERVLQVCNGFLCSMPVTFEHTVVFPQHLLRETLFEEGHCVGVVFSVSDGAISIVDNRHR